MGEEGEERGGGGEGGRVREGEGKKSNIYLRGASQRCITYPPQHKKHPPKKKNPPQASHQFLWYGTNRTYSIKHEPFPQRERQDATRVPKNKRK